MKKYLIALYGVLCYSIFLVVFLYMIAFLANIFVPTTIDGGGGEAGSLGRTLAINLGLIALFGFAHSGMARSSFKEKWTKIIPPAAERSTYVLQASVLLLLILWFWQPLPATLWTFDNPLVRNVIWVVFCIGHIITLISTFLINHFELTGLQQVWFNLRGKEPQPMSFKQPLFYRYVRHPMQLGLLIGYWATPDMTVGHLLFAAAMTVYIMIGLYFEEKALVREFGDVYRDYQRTTPKLIPNFRRPIPVERPVTGD